MNPDEPRDAITSSTPEASPEPEVDETAELRRELTDDEIALVAGGVAGRNETHTMSPI
jgi:hypothetical protein